MHEYLATKSNLPAEKFNAHFLIPWNALQEKIKFVIVMFENVQLFIMMLKMILID